MIVTWFKDLDPIIQALLATCFTWLVTALGSGLVFFFKTINRKVLDLMLGFAAGVMIAASFWSLLSPAIALAEEHALPEWLFRTEAVLQDVLAHRIDRHINAVPAFEPATLPELRATIEGLEQLSVS